MRAIVPEATGTRAVLDSGQKTMLRTDMQRIVKIVCRRAQLRGFVSPQDIRQTLARAGLPEGRWLEVVSLAGDMLTKHDGRFYYAGPARASCPERRPHRHLGQAVRQLIRGYRSTMREERRRQGRFDFVHPVQVEMEDGRTVTILSCDLSTSGIRLVAPFSLLGKKVRVTLPATEGAVHKSFYVQVVWSSLVGEGLYENGATFLGVAGFPQTEAMELPAASYLFTGPGDSVSAPLPSGELPILMRGARQPRPR